MSQPLDYVEQFRQDLDVVEAACNLVIEHKDSAELLAAAGYEVARMFVVVDARLTLQEMGRYREFDCTKAYPWWLYCTGSLASIYIQRTLKAAAKLSQDGKFAELLSRTGKKS